MANKQTKNVGDILKKVREQQKLSIHHIAAELGIRAQYLTCIEQNQFHILPGSVYATRYVKAYAHYLGLDSIPLVKITRTLTAEKGHSVPQYRVRRAHFWVGPRILKYLGLGAMAMGCFGYIVWLGLATITPPVLDVMSPSDNLTSNDRNVVVQGRTTIDAQLTINDQPVMKQEDGSFKQEIQLAQGVNTLKISAVKKHSKEQTIYRTIRYDQSSDDVSFLRSSTIQ
ncbi:MAG: helix-turn-helix domain-containing protein [Patescibacteria group bacterium]